MNESEFDADLFRGPKSLAVTLGWTSYHVLRSKGSRAGFPDRVAWRERTIYAELKSDTGTLREGQAETLTGLARAGAEVYLWRPSDRDEIDQVLGHRWRFDALLPGLYTGLAVADGGRVMLPSSLWLPRGSRVDGRT